MWPIPQFGHTNEDVLNKKLHFFVQRTENISRRTHIAILFLLILQAAGQQDGTYNV